jgi:predicted RNA-binding Zn-ribbon protein involved in translation (DUF1610 family)
MGSLSYYTGNEGLVIGAHHKVREDVMACIYCGATINELDLNDENVYICPGCGASQFGK